ncbi:hypothetical protein L195_g051806, partial [Trifolium pratense]
MSASDNVNQVSMDPITPFQLNAHQHTQLVNHLHLVAPTSAVDSFA